jgi:dolichol-phosphate mannosyltransferase
MCLRTDFLRAVQFEAIKARGYAWQIALKTLLHRRGARIREVPIRFVERRFGRSKLSTNIVYEGLVEPWRIRRRSAT